MDRQDPRPATNATRTRTGVHAAAKDIELTLFVLIDGVRSDVLRELSESGDVPNITRHLVSEGSYLEAVTVLPSVTDVAYIPMLTGQYPGTANIPGVRWVDKSRLTSGRVFVTGHRSYVGPSHRAFSDDLPADVETLFELCSGSMALRSDINRGVSPERNRLHRMSSLLMTFAHYLKRSDFVDRIVLRTVLRALRRKEGDLPPFIFLPLMDVDTNSHANGPHHRRTIAAYRRIDAVIGEIVAGLKRLGLWDRTHFLLSSDHGHTKTIEHLDLGRLLSDLGYRVFEYPNIFRRSVDAAVMISGNSFANVYVASEGRWERPLIGDELEGEHHRLLEAICRRPEVEWVAYRHENDSIKVVSSSGVGLLEKQGEYYTYGYEGVDPLELGIPRSRVHESDALDLTAKTRFPDALEQIWYLFSSKRTGDIVVTAKPGYDLRARREWPEHHSSHGALCWEHMMVPIVSNRPFSAEGPVRTVDLFPTVIESLDLKATKPHFGRSLW